MRKVEFPGLKRFRVWAGATRWLVTEAPRKLTTTGRLTAEIAARRAVNHPGRGQLGGDDAMDPALKRLMKKMPPPPDPTGRDVDWERSEAEIGLTYPASFKEFIGIYGASIWFDNLTPLYPELTSYPDAKTFLAAVKAKLQLLVKYKMLDEKYKEVAMPLYPEEGGLFPFLADYSSYEYFWQTSGKNPDKWPVVCWKVGPIVSLGKITIARMILDFLERKPNMVQLWGDITEYEPGRIRVDRWIPPKQSKRRRR